MFYEFQMAGTPTAINIYDSQKIGQKAIINGEYNVYSVWCFCFIIFLNFIYFYEWIKYVRCQTNGILLLFTMNVYIIRDL